jgi:hypothetical protein
MSRDVLVATYILLMRMMNCFAALIASFVISFRAAVFCRENKNINSIVEHLELQPVLAK